MAKNLDRLIDFIRFTHEIRNVKRAIIFEDDYQENDAEHCYQLALVAWFIVESDNLSLDKFKVVGMAMVHDIVEAYSGDVIAFASKEELKAKKQREEAAIKRLRQNWGTFKSLNELIEEYEQRQSPEIKFVYALDKFLPTVNNYIFEGKVWRKLSITYEDVQQVKKGKVELSPDVNEYYLKFKKILEKQPELFGVKGDKDEEL